MILRIHEMNPTLTFRSAQELHEEHGDLGHQYQLFWRPTFPSNANLPQSLKHDF